MLIYKFTYATSYLPFCPLRQSQLTEKLTVKILFVYVTNQHPYGVIFNSGV